MTKICRDTIQVGLEQLSQKILVGEWKWAQWPVLKTIKLGGLSAATSENWFHNRPNPNVFPQSILYSKEITPYLKKLVCFKGCPTLEKVVISFNNTMSITGIFPNHPDLPLEMIEELTFDPKIDVELVGIEHVTRLKLTVDPRFHRRVRETTQNLHLLRLTAHNLKNISIVSRTSEVVRLDKNSILKNSFWEMVQGLDKTLESLHVIVANTFHMDTFFSDFKPITEIWIESVHMKEMKRCPLTQFFERYKKLRKCRVDLTLLEEDEDQNCDTWPKFVEETYQGWVARYQLPCMADFKFRFVYCKQIVDTIQDEKFQALRLPRQCSIYKRAIRFEITRQ